MGTKPFLVSLLIYLHRFSKCPLWTPQGIITDSSRFENWLIITYADYKFFHIVDATLLAEFFSSIPPLSYYDSTVVLKLKGKTCTKTRATSYTIRCTCVLYPLEYGEYLESFCLSKDGGCIQSICVTKSKLLSRAAQHDRKYLSYA